MKKEEFSKLMDMIGFHKPQLSRLWGGTYAWNSSPANDAIASLVGMNESQLKAFFADKIGMAEASAMAAAALPKWRAQLAQRKLIRGAVKKAASKFAKVTEQPTPKGLLDLATEWVWRRGGALELAPTAVAALHSTLDQDPTSTLPERLQLRAQAAKPEVSESLSEGSHKSRSGSDRPSRRR